jgi:hypothetical protein
MWKCHLKSTAPQSCPIQKLLCFTKLIRNMFGGGDIKESVLPSLENNLQRSTHRCLNFIRFRSSHHLIQYARAGVLRAGFISDD